MSLIHRSIDHFRNAVKELWGLSLDFVIPWQCTLCKTSVDERNSTTQRVFYCRACEERLTESVQTPQESCERCGAILGPYVSTKSGCVHCRDKPLKFDSVTCLGMYNEVLREAILSAKYSPSAVGMQGLSQLLIESRLDSIKAFDPDAVIPIPHHWRMRLTRHFNSSAIIANAVAKALNMPLDDATLTRARLTRPQKRIALKNRFDNQKGAFRVRSPDLLKGKRVLLVDDVLTTGATCSEAASMLKKNGARACCVVVIARVLDSSGA